MTPRIRSIKPEFFSDEDLAQLTPWARLLFISLWTLADREGRLENRPKRIKAHAFPYDAVDIDALLAELVNAKDQHGRPKPFLTPYEIDGRGYLQIGKFTEHQRPNLREPASSLPVIPTSECTHVHARAEQTMTDCGAAGKGREGNKEGKGDAPARDPGGAEHEPPRVLTTTAEFEPLPPTDADPSLPPVEPITPAGLISYLKAGVEKANPGNGPWYPGRFADRDAVEFFRSIGPENLPSIRPKADAFIASKSTEGWPLKEFLDRFNQLGRGPPARPKVVAPITWPKSRTLT